MTLLVASLYLLSICFLAGSGLWVFTRDPYNRLNSSYALLAATLLAWVLTLFVFAPQTGGSPLLWLGRANFAALVLAAPATLQFVHVLAGRPLRYGTWLWGSALAFAALSLFSGLIDQSETVRGTVHVTGYGLFFPPYTIYLLALCGAALWRAFAPSLNIRQQTRAQLRLVGLGILVTTAIAFVADAMLPYYFGNFRYIHVGPLSTIVFLGLVTYAVSIHHLFNARLIIRTTVVYAILIALFLEFYRLAVDALATLLPLQDPVERQIAATAVSLIVNAFTHEVLKEWLRHLVDRLAVRKKTGMRP